MRYFIPAAIFVVLIMVCVMVVDAPLSLWLRQFDSDHHPFFRVIALFEPLGRGQYYYVPLVLLAGFSFLAMRRDSANAQAKILFHKTVFVLGTMVASGLLIPVLKNLFGRARPVLLLRENITGFFPLNFAGASYQSFPSGHTNTVFIFAFAVALVWPRLTIPVFVLAFVVAAERVIMNAHYLGDVLASFAFAFLVSRLAYRLAAEKLKLKE